jgi:hypothetical protein
MDYQAFFELFEWCEPGIIVFMRLPFAWSRLAFFR